jgi:hypothetical protein
MRASVDANGVENANDITATIPKAIHLIVIQTVLI